MKFTSAAGTLAILFFASLAPAQIPEKFTNLQALPKDVGRRELVDTMRRFSFALDVRCEHCHVGGPELSTIDFASDEKTTKRTARQMLRMVKAINEDHLAKLGERHGVAVECFTCHRGISRPEAIESVVAKLLEESGAEAASTRYRELRKSFFGKGSYDFSDTPLNALGQTLLASQKVKEALAVLELNAEFNASSAWLQQLLGEGYLATGDRARAKSCFEKSLALDADNPGVKKRLDELKN